MVKTTYAFFVLLEVALCSLPTVNAVACEPSDEFVDSSTTDYTSEFNNLLDLLEEKTFNTTTTQFCLNSKDKPVVFDYKSDFLWTLRYELYDQGLNNLENKDGNTEPLIVGCYEEQEGECNKEKFRNCMKTLRVKMLEDIQQFWDHRVDGELTKLAKEC